MNAPDCHAIHGGVGTVSYTRGTFAALVDAVVPATPDLAAEGDEHVPGGLDVGLEEVVIDRIDGLQEVDDGPLAALGYDRAPLAPVVAAMLDAAALELVARRDGEDGLQSPADEFSTGPFSRLSRRDRLRAIRLLEEEGALPALADRLRDRAPGAGVVKYLASAVVVLTEFCYYSELTGDGETSQGWRQAGYPGPADGYAVMLGYEVESFEEDDY